MQLSVDVIGDGPTVALLHGWGFDRHVWAPLVATLRTDYRCVIIDLPGFGDSPPLHDQSLPAVLKALLPAMPESAVWLGWSLGGLLASAMAAAVPKGYCRGLITLASTPCWVAGDHWPGMAPADWQQFLIDWQHQSNRQWPHFLRAVTRDAGWRRQYANKSSAQQASMATALHWLAVDVRTEWRDMPCPHHAHWGREDRLLSPQVADAVAQWPTIKAQSWPGGHDFWTQAACMAAIKTQIAACFKVEAA